MRFDSLRFCLFLLLWTSITSARDSNSLIDYSADGESLVTVNHDNGSITVVNRKDWSVAREIPVGHKPEGVTFLGESKQVAVTIYAEDLVAIVDTESGEILRKIPVFDEPYGVVSTARGNKIFVTMEYPGQVAVIDPHQGTILANWDAGKMVRGIALAPDEARIYVTEYLSGRVHALDTSSGKVVDTWKGNSSDNLARQITIHPTRPKLYVPHIRSRVNVNRGEGSVVPNLSVLDITTADRRRNAIALDSFISVFVVANPWEVAVSPDGKLLGVIFAGTNDMFFCDVLDDDYREVASRRILRLGNNPRAIQFSPDSQSFAVFNTLDFTIEEYRCDSLRARKLKVSENPLGEEILRGKILFYSALEPMVGRRWISCSSCHPDGDADGRTWQNPEGLRNTTPLHGMAWTHPIHWSADRDEVQDFELTIRSQLMQGRGLIRGVVNDALSDPNSGLSEDLDALAAYSNSHKVPLSPHAKSGLSESAQRGKELFFSETTQCAKCHKGPFFTDSTPDFPFKLHDVGTGKEDPSEMLGPKYDTPTLLGIYRTAPYLHHGKAQSIESVITDYNRNDSHGKTSHLKEDQIQDLANFLRSLPYEDPEPAAKSEGLKKIEK